MMKRARPFGWLWSLWFTWTLVGGVPCALAVESGWWWNPDEGGRGFTIEVQKGSMFMAGYMYDASGAPVWYAAGPTAMVNATTFQGTLVQYGNGQTLNGTWRAASVRDPNVGPITLQFSDERTAVMTLPNGRQIPIQRYAFGPGANVFGTQYDSLLLTVRINWVAGANSAYTFNMTLRVLDASGSQVGVSPVYAEASQITVGVRTNTNGVTPLTTIPSTSVDHIGAAYPRATGVSYKIDLGATTCRVTSGGTGTIAASAVDTGGSLVSYPNVIIDCPNT